MLEDYVAVSVLALYYDVPSSNHAEVYILELCKINDKKIGAGNGPFWNDELQE